MRQIALIAHNIRSTHNVGSILRTADGLGVNKVYLTGYTPYPKLKEDNRLPHLANKLHNQIIKTSLGAEKLLNISYSPDIADVITQLKSQQYKIYALEQNKDSRPLNNFKPADKIALIVGNELSGIDSALLNMSDQIIEIPMLGKKESFNVSVAAAIALYYLRYC